ncbi:IS1-like element transposase [Spirosoma jeollabukense]
MNVCATYTHKDRDPLLEEHITQIVLDGSGVRDTARILGVK